MGRDDRTLTRTDGRGDRLVPVGQNALHGVLEAFGQRELLGA